MTYLQTMEESWYSYGRVPVSNPMEMGLVKETTSDVSMTQC
jgi:hypothetical protein